MRKKVGIAALVAVAVLVLIGGVSAWWQMQPPAMPDDIDEALAVLQSSRYQRLPESRRQPYLERSRELFEGLDAEERRRVGERVRNDAELKRAVDEAMMDQMYARAREFVLASAEDRRRAVDTIIWMQELQRQRAANRGAAASDPEAEARRERRRAEAVSQIGRHLEQGNAHKQGHFMDMMKAISDRRRERGMDPNPPLR